MIAKHPMTCDNERSEAAPGGNPKRPLTHLLDLGERGLAMKATQCSVAGCEKPVRARGWCGMHSERMRRHGNLTGVRPTVPEADRFARYLPDDVDPDSCWEWTGMLNNNGYGKFHLLGGKGPSQIYAHRYAYEHSVGPIPEGLSVMHSCDNPPCVNPAHLSVGTAADNAADKVSKGRSRRATCVKGHPWTPESTSHFIDRNGHANRRCLICRRERESR